MKNRPTNILVIGIVGIIGGVLGIIGSAGVFTTGALLSAVGVVGVGAGIKALGTILLIVSILQLVSSIAFLSLKKWAWWGLIIVLALDIVLSIALMASWNFSGSNLVSILIDAALIWYLNSKYVKPIIFGADAPDLLAKVTGGRLHDDQIMPKNS